MEVAVVEKVWVGLRVGDWEREESEKLALKVGVRLPLLV